MDPQWIATIAAILAALGATAAATIATLALRRASISDRREEALAESTFMPQLGIQAYLNGNNISLAIWAYGDKPAHNPEFIVLDRYAQPTDRHSSHPNFGEFLNELWRLRNLTLYPLGMHPLQPWVSTLVIPTCKFSTLPEEIRIIYVGGKLKDRFGNEFAIPSVRIDLEALV